MKDKIYLTFPTDPETAYALKTFAHKMGMTQPQLINEICKDFIKTILEFVKDYEQNEKQE